MGGRPFCWIGWFHGNRYVTTFLRNIIETSEFRTEHTLLYKHISARRQLQYRTAVFAEKPKLNVIGRR